MYSQNNNQGNSNSQGDKQAGNIQRNEIQREIIMHESDYKKKLLEKNSIDADIRALKKDEARLRVEIQVRQLRLNKVEQDVAMIDAEIKNLRKKLNTII